MAAPIFGFPNYSDESVLYTPTLSGGSWETGDVALENVQDGQMSRVARSTDASAASTQFEVDLKVARPLRVFAVVLPNVTSAGTVRIRASNVASDFTAPLFDSETLTPYPADQTAETLENIPPTARAVADADVSARYVLVEISDPANPDGYLDVARIFLAGGFQFERGARYGWQFGTESDSETDYRDSGSAIHDERPQRRTWTFEQAPIDDAGALGGGGAHELKRRAGTSRQIFFVFDPDDEEYAWLRDFACTLRGPLSPIEHFSFNLNTTAWQLVEEL